MRLEKGRDKMREFCPQKSFSWISRQNLVYRTARITTRYAYFWLWTLDPGPSTLYGALRSFGWLTLIGTPLVNEAMTLGSLVRSAEEINSARPAPANSEPQT